MVGRAVELGDDLGQPVERQEVGEGAVSLLDRQLQHLAAQRGEHDRHLVRRLRFQLEAGRGALAGQGDLEEFEGFAHLRQRLFEGDPVPAFDDPVRGGADAEDEAPLRGVGERRRLLGEQRRPALEDADDPGPEPHLLGPGGAQRQRREAVRPRRLAGPQVGVARRLGALHVLAVIGQRYPAERQRQTPTSFHAATL